MALLHFAFGDYSTSLANALADMVDLTVIHSDEMSAGWGSLLDPRIHIKTLPKPRRRSLRSVPAMIALRQLIRHEKPDVLHIQASGEFWFELSLLFGSLPPLVTTVHDAALHPGDRQSDKIPGYQYSTRVSGYRSQQVISHAQTQRKLLVDQWHIPAHRTNVVSIGEYGTVYLRQAGGKTALREPYTLLFFGRIWPYKGLRFLLEAMPLVSERFPQVKLIIAGTGEDLNNYFPDGIDPSRYEIINTFLPNEEVAALFQRSAITVLPYIEASQSGVAAVSYGFGTPVIASNTGGLGELIRDGEDGMLVPPGDSRALADAIIRLLGDPALQRQMQSAGLARCESDLSWPSIARQTVEVYRKAINGNHSHSS